MTVVLAEKGISSTYDKLPVQAQYRDAHLWSAYKKGQELLMLSTRKPLVASCIIQKISRAKERTFIELLYSKLKEKGLIWSFRKAISKLILHLRQQRVNNEIKGFKYLGKM